MRSLGSVFLAAGLLLVASRARASAPEVVYPDHPNVVPAVRSYGTLCLVEANPTGRDGAARLPAIVNYNRGTFCQRDVATIGYGRALGDVETPDFVAAYRLQGEDKPGSAGPTVAEYFSRSPTSPFPSRTGSLRLPIEETPEFPPDDPKTWAVVDAFGADPTGKADSADALQKALDSGASTVFFPGQYAISKTLLVRGKAQRIVGVGGWVDQAKRAKPGFRVAAGDADVVTFEHLASINSGIENPTDRTLVLRSIGTQIFSKGVGKLFFEDVAGHELAIKNQRVFARQMNIENEGTHLLNDGGDLWILSYKAEHGGALIHTKSGERNCSAVSGTRPPPPRSRRRSSSTIRRSSRSSAKSARAY